ncbi:MAG TPA: dTMP kinase [Acidimicrobiia bacterium]|nr:dTMP kinase [Acidimicrobiia bacterium]
MYIALEGGDGAGKTTVAARLVELLEEKGDTVVAVREPGGTALGEEIRRLLLHSSDMTAWSEALLFAAQRSQLAAEVIGPALGRGEVVIADRSYYSSLAYQGGGRALDPQLVRLINEAALEGVIPDLVVVLTIDPAEALARQADPDRIGRQGAQFQEAVARVYRELARSEPDRVRLIEMGDDPDDVARAIFAMIEERRFG